MADNKSKTGEDKETKPVELTPEQLAAENEQLKAELQALKTEKEATQPEKVEIPSDKDRTFTYEGKQYKILAQSHIWCSGVKKLTSEAAKNKEIIKSLVENKSKLIKEL